MNEIAVGIRYNDKVNLTGFRFYKLATLKAIARYKIARLKRNISRTVERATISRVVERVTMAFNPMPNMVMA